MIDIALDLADLTDRPEKVVKVPRRESRLGRVILGLAMVNRMSSTNNDNVIVNVWSTRYFHPHSIWVGSDGLRQGFQCKDK